METYETSGTVEGEGRIVVASLPFAAGTEVEISIRPKIPNAEPMLPIEDESLATVRTRMRELFQTVKGFQMTPKLSREELYDRPSLR